jgi:hypothetical protein
VRLSHRAYSKACAQKGSPASRAALISGTAEFAAGRREVGSVVSEDRVDPLGDSLDQSAQQVRSRAAGHLLMQFDEGEFDIRSIATRIELALGGCT